MSPPFDGGTGRGDHDGRLTNKKAPRKPTKAVATKLEDGLYIADQIGHELRMRGHDLLRDASNRRNKREISAGHIMRELGNIVGQGGVWTAGELARLAKKDPVLAQLEKARVALTKAVELERARREKQLSAMHEDHRAVMRMLELEDPGPYQGPAGDYDALEPIGAREPHTKIAGRYVKQMLDPDWSVLSLKPPEIADWLELQRAFLMDFELLGRAGTPNERRAAWAPLISKVLRRDLRNDEKRAQQVVTACAGQQGYPRSDNLFPD